MTGSLFTYADHLPPERLLVRLVWHIGTVLSASVRSGTPPCFSGSKIGGVAFADLIDRLNAAVLLAGKKPPPGWGGSLRLLRADLSSLISLPSHLAGFRVLEEDEEEGRLRLTADAYDLYLQVGPSYTDSRERAAFALLKAACLRAGPAAAACYTKARLIIVRMPVAPARTLLDALSDLPGEVVGAVMDAYVPSGLGECRCCAHCGWPMPPGSASCLTPACTVRTASSRTVSAGGREHLMILKDYARLFWHAPGVPEVDLGLRLEKAGASVAYYPDLDGYDIHAEKNGRVWAIDLKDMRRYDGLKPPAFRSAPPGTLLRVVVPDHRDLPGKGALERVQAVCEGHGMAARSASEMVHEIESA